MSEINLSEVFQESCSRCPDGKRAHCEKALAQIATIDELDVPANLVADIAALRKEKEETIKRLAKPCGGLWFVPGGDTIVEVCGQDNDIVVIGGSRKGGFHRYKRDDVTRLGVEILPDAKI
jgi:hypothetical protein